MNPRTADDRLKRFRNLMPRRVRRLLLVASRYDASLLAEDGQTGDPSLTETLATTLSDPPWIKRVSDGEKALAALADARHRFDLVVATMHIRRMDVLEFAARARQTRPGTPVVVLVFNSEELAEIRARGDLAAIERLFVWQGDFRILLGIVKSIEDRWNVEADTAHVGVSSVILIEDSVRYYSAFLPLIYAELLKQSQRVIAEGTDLTNKVMRLRARPKILHCISYEQAIDYYERFRTTLLGVISDVDFPRNGRPHAASGLDFARMVRQRDPELPILLQTRDPGYADKARAVQTEILLKDSPSLLEDLSRFIRDRFGFGDFVFRAPDGKEVGRARDLRELETMLRTVPDASLREHAERNHFSTWLRARTEFALAERLRPRHISEFASLAEVRAYLVAAIHDFRRTRQSGVVAVFEPQTFEPETSFAKIGGGSIGGKARGIAFMRRLLSESRLRSRSAGVRIFVPSAVVLATDVFDQMLDDNRLRDFALRERDDDEIERRFLAARLPPSVLARLERYVELADYPLAVRSSSLLEDSQHFSFTGVYRTYMVANSDRDRRIRVQQLENAIKRIYASTFCSRAKAYIKATPYRLDQEKMAVILQRLVGVRHGSRFYPDLAGVARSHNYYPAPPMKAADGIVSVALGLGETVVGGGHAVRFSPKYPKHGVAYSAASEVLRNAQTEFYALRVDEPQSRPDPDAEQRLERFPVATAIEDGTFAAVGSIYSPENDAVYDGSGRPGVPVVTFAPILKHGLFPLAKIVSHLLGVGRRALNTPVEIEFAANVARAGGSDGAGGEFAVLQVRPFAERSEDKAIDVGDLPDERLVCRSERALGNGCITGIRDVVVVDRERFDRAHSVEVANDVARCNGTLVAERRPYVLIGVGRWGAADPWLGIPVTWEQICGARTIVEANFKDLAVEPSQGSHFFQNLATSLVGYFTIGGERGDGFVDWDWLARTEAVTETAFVRHLRLVSPLEVRMDGRSGRGVILKPQ